MRDLELGEAVIITTAEESQNGLLVQYLKDVPLSHISSRHALIQRWHVDQLHAVSPSISSNCDNNQALTAVPVFVVTKINSADLVSYSGLFTPSTFTDRYPITQCSAYDRYGLSSPSD